MMVSAVASAPQPYARALDGDYKSPNAQSSQTKDTDGDYKAKATNSSASQVKSANPTPASSATQAALYSLKFGG